MTKKIFAIAVLALAATGLSSAAFAGKDSKDKTCAKPTCTETRQCASDSCKQRPNPFIGLNLTAEQQQQLKALKDERGNQRAQARSERRERAQRDVKAAKEDTRAWLAKVKEILTPEQYVQFLENSFVNSPRRADGKKVDGQRHQHKGHHHGQHGDRPQRPERPATAE